MVHKEEQVSVPVYWDIVPSFIVAIAYLELNPLVV